MPLVPALVCKYVLSICVTRLFVVVILILVKSYGFLIIGNPCVIPNQKDKGQCVERGDCPKYLSLFQTSNLTMAKLSFIRRVHCEATTEDEETRVCCPTESSDYV